MRIVTAPVARADLVAATVAQLAVTALNPPTPELNDPTLVEVSAVHHDVHVELREPLASFARAHGCRRVLAHRHTDAGVDVATVVLVRHAGS